jgi:hypothetical protein
LRWQWLLLRNLVADPTTGECPETSTGLSRLPEPRPANEIEDSLVGARLYLTGIDRHLQNDLWRSLGDIELLAVRALDRRLGVLMHGIKRGEMENLIGLQRLVVLHATENGKVNRVLVFGARSQGARQNNLVGGNSTDAKRIAKLQLILG